jgi:hypothetical protein
MTDEDKGQMDQKSYNMHKHKNVTCYECGKKGHHANKCCPSGDSDDLEPPIRSSQSNRSKNSRPNRVGGWNG